MDRRRLKDGAFIFIGIEPEIELAEPRPIVARCIRRRLDGNDAEEIPGADKRQFTIETTRRDKREQINGALRTFIRRYNAADL